MVPAGAAALIAAGAFTLTGAISNGGDVIIGYTYDPAAANLDFLRNGQSLTITYRCRCPTGAARHPGRHLHRHRHQRRPVLSDTTNPPAVLELLDALAQNLAPIAGNFSVTDLDIGDTLTPSVVGGPTVLLNGDPFTLPAGAAALIAAGAFTLTGAISNGGAVNIGYTYDPAAANLGFLSSGQSLTITYTVQVYDGLSTSATQDVTFTITGTNDAPVLSDTTNPAAVLELLDASAQNLAPITGNFSVTDLDIGDTLTPSVVGGPTVLLNGGAFVCRPALRH